VVGDGRRIRLDQVAKVSDTVAEKRSAALLNGEPVVGFEVTRSRGAGEVEVAAGVRAFTRQTSAATSFAASSAPALALASQGAGSAMPASCFRNTSVTADSGNFASTISASMAFARSLTT
jgi:hypothetical protein